MPAAIREFGFLQPVRDDKKDMALGGTSVFSDWQPASVLRGVATGAWAG